MIFTFFTNSLSILPTQYLRREARLVDIGPSHRTSPQNSTLVQIQNPFKFQLRTTSSSFPFHPFRTLHFSHFPPPTVHFLSGPWIVMGSKVDGHWTLPYKMTLGRPLPNSKPFQIHTEDNSLFLSLSPFSDFVFFKFFTNSLSIVSPP